MTLHEELESQLVDRCMVCGGERPDRHRRHVAVTLGGAYAQLNLTIEYCADDSACGEARALHLADDLTAAFVVVDLRRRGASLLDLRLPEEL